MPGKAEQTLLFIPHPTGANERFGFSPTPAHPQTLSPALFTVKGKDNGSSSTALVIAAGIISVSVYLPGIATGTHWQHPVVSKRELPHKSFPMLPHSCAIQSIRLSSLAGRSFLDIEQGPGLSWWQRGTVLSHAYFCSSQIARLIPGFQTTVFYKRCLCGFREDAQLLPGVNVGIVLSPLLPPPLPVPETGTRSPEAAPCSPRSPQTCNSPQTNRIQ